MNLHYWSCLCCFALGLVFASPAYTTTFEVTPVQIFLSIAQPIASIKVTNCSDTDSTLQLNVVAWQQKNEKDIYQTSYDVFMTPPLFQLPAHKTQVIRFALKRPYFSMQQQIYRVHIRELEEKRQHKIGQALYFLIDISVPLFIQPQQIIEEFIWSTRRLDPKHIALKLQNVGNVTVFTDQWKLLNKLEHAVIAKRSTFTYILPGQSHSWIVAINSDKKPTHIISIINAHTHTSVLHQF